MSNELNPCPVCGGVAVLEKHYHRRSPTTFSARCKYCCFGTISHEDRGLVVETWNRLTPEDHIVDVNKKEPDNPPLTMDEIRGMAEEPVWVEEFGMWALVYIHGNWDPHLMLGDGSPVLNHPARNHTLYRRKPEEE